MSISGYDGMFGVKAWVWLREKSLEKLLESLHPCQVLQDIDDSSASHGPNEVQLVK